MDSCVGASLQEVDDLCCELCKGGGRWKMENNVQEVGVVGFEDELPPFCDCIFTKHSDENYFSF